MSTIHSSELSSSELCMLWTTYVEDSLALCVLNHFSSVVEDPDVNEIIQFAKKISSEHLVFIQGLFKKEEIPVPQGFSNHDWIEGAPRLFSDVFNLRYLGHMGRSGLCMYGAAKGTSSREDVRSFFTTCLNQASELYDRVTNMMLEKGVHVRSPMITYPKAVEFVENEHFLSPGFLSEKRPLLANEIAHLSLNIETNSIGMTLLLGFAQCTQDEETKKYITRGFEIAKKATEVFSSILRTQNIPAPGTWDSTVTDSTVPPFSDKLMLFHVNMLTAMGIGNYGMAMGASMRLDLGAQYGRLLAESGKYAEDGANLMIKKGWLEKPPQALDRDKLIK
ncbi:DUF3231 family protein [Cytobacillus sp. FJAT-54145]|uniref:DUF3231 family protein n=1 Tax=Cytobacillus spartinae TaxID=3299023 RepID=A0ABW6KET9_9BACI